MSRLALVLTFAATMFLRPGAAGAEEPLPEQRAFVDVMSPHDTVYVGEVVELMLVIGYDQDWFGRHATALFRQPMDLPVRVVAPAFLATESLRPLPDPEDPQEEGPQEEDPHLPTFALGDEVVRSTGAGLATIRTLPGSLGRKESAMLRRRFVVLREGEIRLDAPTLEFGWSPRFETDLLGVRVPVETHRVRLVGSVLTLRAEPLPVTGRPPEFRGLIGSYRLRAEADRTEVTMGELLRLTLTIEGRGNLETLPAPRFDGLERFHVVGSLDETTLLGRVLRLDLTPLDAGAQVIPALALAFYDRTSGAGYRVARTQPIPLTVRGSPPPQDPPSPPPPEPARSGDGLLALALGLLALLGAGLWLRRRRARALVAGEPEGRMEQALERLRALAQSGSPAAGEALIDVLALCLGTAPAAVVAPDLAARLGRAGLSTELAARTAEAVEVLVAARYAGGASAPAPLQPSLIAELEQAVRGRRTG